MWAIGGNILVLGKDFQFLFFLLLELPSSCFTKVFLFQVNASSLATLKLLFFPSSDAAPPIGRPQEGSEASAWNPW